MSRKEKTFSIKILHVLSGLAVCIGIAIISKLIGRFLPSLGAATISIFLGILIGNTIGKHDSLHKGTKFAEGTLLSISVALASVKNRSAKEGVHAVEEVHSHTHQSRIKMRGILLDSLLPVLCFH